MLRRIFVILLTGQLLLNGVVASAHMAVDQHAAHDIPHLHIDTHIHEDNINKDEIGKRDDKNRISSDEQDSSNPLEHDEDTHVHIHLHLFVFSNDSYQLDRISYSAPTNIEPLLYSYISAPPVPPPNI